MAINPRIKQKAEDIRSKIFGSEVRESLASGIEAISEDVEATIGRQGYVEEQFQDVLDETTGKDVISAPEIIAARGGHDNLSQRLLSTDQQLQHMEIKVFEDFPSTSQLKEGEFGFVKKSTLEDLYNLSLQSHSLGVNRPKLWSEITNRGGGTKTIDIVTNPDLQNNPSQYAQKITHLGGATNGYAGIMGFDVMSLHGGEGLKKSGLINFQFDIYPLSENTTAGDGYYSAGIEVSLRRKDKTEITVLYGVVIHKNYPAFETPNNYDVANVPMNKWTTVNWDIYSALNDNVIDVNEVHSIRLSIVGNSNNSDSSVSFLVNNLSF